jgi:hypothetical protein
VKRIRILLLVLAATLPAVALAQDPIKLNMSDIYFQWRPTPKSSAMCGYAIRGNRLSREDPKTEWDINIDEIVQGDTRVVGVSAGSFIVTGKTRAPRSPITELTFTTQDDAEPLALQLVGTPNKDNGVRGMLDLTRAAKLFKSLSNDRQINATLTYADGASDRLQFSGFRDVRKFGGGKNSPFDECLRGVTPKPGSPEWDIRMNAH